MKKTIMLVLALMIMLMCFTGCSSRRGSNGYSSPEETVEAFFNYTKNQDLDGMVACSFIQPFLEELSYEEYEKMAAPQKNESGTYKQSLKEILEESFSIEIEIMLYGLVIEDIHTYDINQLRSNASATEGVFLSDIDYSKLDSLKVLRIDLYEVVPLNNFQEMFEFSGADDVVDLTVLIEVDGESFALPVSLLEYDESWYIYSVGSFFNEALELPSTVNEAEYNVIKLEKEMETNAYKAFMENQTNQ